VHTEFMSAPDSTGRQNALIQLSRAANGLAAAAATASLTAMARVAEAYQALLQLLHDRDDLVTASTRRTSLLGLESITALGTPGTAASLTDIQPRALLADSNQLSIKLAAFAFDKAGIHTTVVDHAEAAIRRLRTDRFDLIALDSDIPGMTALECARRLRQVIRTDAPITLLCPVNVFTQNLNAVEAVPADLIAKPYPAAEFALLALCRIYRHRLARAT
jgi:CheY-like chemotaxis protein